MFCVVVTILKFETSNPCGCEIASVAKTGRGYESVGVTIIKIHQTLQIISSRVV